MTDADTQTKSFECYLVVDWKHETIRQRKTEPTDIAPTELAIPVSLDINVPEVSVPTIEAAIDVPAAQVEHSVVEETRELAEDRGPVDE